jgi:hypothetical protein
MNTIIIVLGVIILILIYILFKYFSTNYTNLNTTTNLNNIIPAMKIANSPTATRYCYSAWIYINSWDNNVNKVIFSRANNLKLYLSKSSPTLKLDMAMNDGSKGSMIVTDNFPIQKWCFIAISVDNQYVDAYLDGKLIKSQRFYNQSLSGNQQVGIMPIVPPDSNTPIYLGNSDISSVQFTAFDAYVAKFHHYSSPIDPQTAWNAYLDGNGNYFTNSLSAYGINLNILKNNVEQQQIILW